NGNVVFLPLPPRGRFGGMPAGHVPAAPAPAVAEEAAPSAPAPASEPPDVPRAFPASARPVPERLRSCPVWPDCGCTERCAGDMEPERITAAGWILILCIIAATVLSAMI